LAFLLAGCLAGLFVVNAGQLIGQAQSEAARAIECAPFPMELQRHSSSEFRIIAPANQAVYLDVDFLEINGDIIGTLPVQRARSLRVAYSVSSSLTTKVPKAGEWTWHTWSLSRKGAVWEKTKVASDNQVRGTLLEIGVPAMPIASRAHHEGTPLGHSSCATAGSAPAVW